MYHKNPSLAQFCSIYSSAIHFTFGWGNLHNSADDSMLSDQADSIGEPVENSQYLSKVAIDWMDQNNMITNPSKFHAILLSNTAPKLIEYQFR